MKEETVILDLTSFKKISGKLIQDKLYELKLIEYYSFFLSTLYHRVLIM